MVVVLHPGVLQMGIETGPVTLFPSGEFSS